MPNTQTLSDRLDDLATLRRQRETAERDLARLEAEEVALARESMRTVTEAQKAALHEAICQLDALWAFDACRGLHDDIGGAEYLRESPAARLQELLDRASS